MKPTRYKDPNRLADVMALIQVLAQGPSAIRTEHGLSEQLRGKPTSEATSWTSLAESHREFFRVRPPENGNSQIDVALIWRHALSKGKAGERSPLSPESTAKLLEIAVSLHDRDIMRSQRFAYLIPIAVIILGGLGTILFWVIRIYFNLPPVSN